MQTNRIVDTHAHLYVEEFTTDRDAVIHRAMEAGVSDFFLPNIDLESIGPMLDLEAAFPGHCHPMMGLHPCSVNAQFRETLSVMREWLSRRPFCAIGEIGMDLYWDQTYVKEQEIALRMQLDWAIELDVPVVIHSRDSMNNILDIMEPMQDKRLRGIFHCFSGTLEQAESAIRLGFLLGIGGVLTYKNAGLDAVVREIDLKHLVLETDSPYLSPVPFRGKRNESAYIIKVLEKLAEVKQEPVGVIAEATTQNALSLFMA